MLERRPRIAWPLPGNELAGRSLQLGGLGGRGTGGPDFVPYPKAPLGEPGVIEDRRILRQVLIGGQQFQLFEGARVVGAGQFQQGQGQTIASGRRFLVTGVAGQKLPILLDGGREVLSPGTPGRPV